jgi:hypothetical protein
MSQNQQEFINQLPEILRLFSEPVTIHTASEIWCRISIPDWDNCLPILFQELKSNDPCVMRLIFGIFQKESEIMGPDTLVSSIPTIMKYLKQEDPTVRQAVIYLLSSMQISNDQILDDLKSIMLNDEPYLATEAALAILKLNPGEADGLIPFLIEQLSGDDLTIQSLILDNIELLGTHSSEFLPYISELLNEEISEWEASIAFLKLTADPTPARKLIRCWRESDDPINRGAANELESQMNKLLNSF